MSDVEQPSALPARMHAIADCIPGPCSRAILTSLRMLLPKASRSSLLAYVRDQLQTPGQSVA